MIEYIAIVSIISTVLIVQKVSECIFNEIRIRGIAANVVVVPNNQIFDKVSERNLPTNFNECNIEYSHIKQHIIHEFQNANLCSIPTH